MNNTARSTFLQALETMVAVAWIVAVGGGCGRGLVSGAGGNPGSDAGAGGNGVITVCRPTPSGSPCSSTCAQAQQILTSECAVCHEGAGSVGAPLTSILDLDALEGLTNQVSYPGWRYVVPGDPERSLIYHRAVVVQDMPILCSGCELPGIRLLTTSEGSVLKQWISQCLSTDIADAGGTGGTSGHDGGTSGTGGRIEEGTVASCPAQADSGSACAQPGISCAFLDKTCVCDGGSWRCGACPPNQPSTQSSCSPVATDGGDGSGALPLNCHYGNVTCSCAGKPARAETAALWGCGVCPATQPTFGDSCGNTPFDCSYASATCSCLNGVWNCQTVPCPSVEASVPWSCYGIYSCQYPREDQSCSCPSWSCSCPTSIPAQGSTCVGNPSCAFGDTTCTCNGAAWHCATVCPAAQPAAGAPCATSLSCNYQNTLCYCANDVWICSP